MNESITQIFSFTLNVVMMAVTGFFAYKWKKHEKQDDAKHAQEVAEKAKSEVAEAVAKEKDRDLYLETLKMTQEQVNQLRAELTETGIRHDVEMKSMHKTIDDLKEKVSTLKTNILTMSMFGTDGPTAMWAKDTTGRRTWHNKEYEKLTGYKLSDCMTKTDFEITGNKEISRAWGANDREVINRNIYVVTVEPCFHKDRPKEIFYVLVIKWPRRMGGHIVGVDGSAHRMDEILTAIKDSESVESV